MSDRAADVRHDPGSCLTAPRDVFSSARRMTGSALRPAVWLAAAAAALALAPEALAAQDPEAPLFADACPTGDPAQVLVSLEGMVRDRRSETPLPGARVRLDLEEGGAVDPDAPAAEAAATAVRETTSDDDGRYRFCGLPAFGRWRLEARFEDHTGREVTFDLDRDLRFDLTVDLGRPAYLVFSVVAAETGSPIPGAWVELGPIPLAGVTDSLGRAAMRAAPPGDYRLQARHIGYAQQEQAITVEEAQFAEFRIEMVAEAIALEPLRVEITGRDAYLLDMGFYERMNTIPEGYFATQKEIRPYRMLRTLFQFKRELFVRYARNQFIVIDGRAMRRRGFRSRQELNEIPFSRIRGIEAFRCSEAPPRIMNQLMPDVPLGDCNMVLIWTR